MAMVAMGTIIYAALMVWFRRENQLRDSGKSSSNKKVAQMNEAEIEEMGEWNPRYRYTY
jgi:hypothetical protein